MCGICGQFNFDDRAAVERETIARMMASLVHRGPDDEGEYIAGPLGLGFRRLSIIDLEGGHQPMSNESGSIRVVFNGEIYNYRELRRELEGHGYVFRTASDTEVIIHGYARWGEDVLNHLNGMFGLAIWDEKNRRLTVARDRYGIKLVYYRLAGGSLFFGSEIRAVLAGSGEAPRVDPVALNLLLRYRYTPSPLTILQDVRKLAPGTLIRCEGGQCTEHRWYRYSPRPFSPMKSDAEAEAELAELYRQAVKRHLIADVPVGLLLSGGVDSSLLLALMRQSGGSWRTYTVGYGTDFADDELVDAARTAERYSSIHTSVRLDQRMFDEALPKIVSCLEEPIASSSIVPMYFVCERARQDVKVALVGQGPDELFGGYRRHLGVRYAAAWSGLPGWVRTPVGALVNALPRNETLKRGVAALHPAGRMQRYRGVLSLMSGETVDGLFADGILGDGAPGEAILQCWDGIGDLSQDLDELGGFQFLEVRSTLPDELLMYADKLSMAHSLEIRVPFLDKEIVEYAERLSANFKVRGRTRKWLHRRVCRTLLPQEILTRKKRGFAVNVVDDWLRRGTRNGLACLLLDPESLLYRYLRRPAVEELLRQHQSGQRDNHKLLFSLIVIEQWLRAR
ncbi:MAG: asparagine synthase (glutamine-hydrolyzing) [Bryobacterales bacterium]|nr:asparagine synthase (glutamine-hydrolyzing) [Bryobacterales bacterium]